MSRSLSMANGSRPLAGIGAAQVSTRLGIYPRSIQRWRRLCNWPWRFLPSSGAMKARSTRLLAEFRRPLLCDGRLPTRSGRSHCRLVSFAIPTISLDSSRTVSWLPTYHRRCARPSSGASSPRTRSEGCSGRCGPGGKRRAPKVCSIRSRKSSCILRRYSKEPTAFSCMLRKGVPDVSLSRPTQPR